MMTFETSEGHISVRFHSMHSIRALEVDSGSGMMSPGKAATSLEDRAEVSRKEAILEDLQAYQVKSAAVCCGS